MRDMLFAAHRMTTGSRHLSLCHRSNCTMRIQHDVTVVRLPSRDPKAPDWSQSTEFLADKVVLQNGMYAKLFGNTLAEQTLGQPWKRGVVRIRVVDTNGARMIRRVFHGSGSLSVTQDQIGLDVVACAQLGIAWGDTVAIELRGGDGPLQRVVDRFLHYWNHPTDAVRAAFKLGAVSLAISLMGVAQWMLDAIRPG